jgi:hypothetical protein
MIILPNSISSIYQPASSHDIHSWSFGAISVLRNSDATDWKDRKKTLDDEAIFGPTIDCKCSCGKYDGKRYGGMICDRCGVKVTTPDCRRLRFGHIDLPSPVLHPFAESSLELDAFPVMPAFFRESEGGKLLDTLYKAVLRSLNPFKPDKVIEVFETIIRILLPMVVGTTRWNLQDVSSFLGALP